jgi:hypothetical protein
MDDISQLKYVKSLQSLQEIVSNRIAINNVNTEISTEFFDLDILPPIIKEDIEIKIEHIKENISKKLIDTAFKSVSRFLDRLPRGNPKKFSLYYENKNRCDITPFLWRLKAYPNILTELGYTDYKLSLEVISISPGTYNDESQYNLTIEEPLYGIKAIYTSILGRFD